MYLFQKTFSVYVAQFVDLWRWTPRTTLYTRCVLGYRFVVAIVVVVVQFWFLLN